MLIHKPVIAGGIPPEQNNKECCDRQAPNVENHSSLMVTVHAEHFRRNRQKGHAQQEEHIEPDEDIVGTPDVVEDALVRHPIDTHNDEA